MLSTIIAKSMEHVRRKIEERNIPIDMEYIEYYLAPKLPETGDYAILLGEMEDDIRGYSEIVLIERNGIPETIFPRQITGTFTAEAFNVDNVISLKDLLSLRV